ncbi:response regulator [Clostridium oryzae]|uniref:Stage 0 sporulation protein A homolog n=1 Tax=Clostridium oryzae TaxID=1450648 RepID=A0A1V4IVC9_9CLOT|nr:response regulator [Clostridium oryzae]OPJ63744.1 transcriptional regulatory protein YpdB [Clostridium oryzae]
MIRAIVVEDEWYNLQEISELIKDTGCIAVEGKYLNPLDALEESDDISPQLAFIDVDMPEMDGITLAEKLMEKNPKINIVFITAYDQYAVKAFDVNALDYIMKPINIKRFNVMIEKVKNKINFIEHNGTSTLTIKCFDDLLVNIDGTPVKWGRSKAEELFALLLMNLDSYVHKDVIIEYLWPKYEKHRALPILQTTVYKTRKIFAELKDKVSLDYSGNKYCLIIRNAQCDYIEFNKALANYTSEDETTYGAVEEAANIFGDVFLSKQGYIWSFEKNEKLKKELASILDEISEVYFSEGQYDSSIKILKSLVKIVPYYEKASYRMIKSMERLNKHTDIKNYYKWLEKILRSEYDMCPAKRISDLVRSLDS